VKPYSNHNSIRANKEGSPCFRADLQDSKT
jgi:hypothetical protein